MLASSEKKLGPDNPATNLTRDNLAVSYRASGRPSKAVALHQQAVEGLAKALGADHPETLHAAKNLAMALDVVRRYARAEPIWREHLERALKASGPDDPGSADAMAQLGANLVRQGKWADAEPILRQCLTVREKAKPDAWNTSNVRSLLGGSLLGLERFAEAEPLIVPGYEGMKAREATIPPESKHYFSEAAERVVWLYDAWGKPQEAREWKARLGPVDLPADVFARP